MDREDAQRDGGRPDVRGHDIDDGGIDRSGGGEQAQLRGDDGGPKDAGSRRGEGDEGEGRRHERDDSGKPQIRLL